MNTPERVLRKITSDSLATYLAEVRRQSVPTPAEEVALGRRIQAGDTEALRELVERNLRFVVQVANKYKGYGLPLADLINEGNVGLLHAASKFDPEHGTRFITYAVWWIRQAIMHALAEGGGAVRLPIKQAEALAAISVSGLASRVPRERVPELGRLVRETARDMTLALGGRLPGAA